GVGFWSVADGRKPYRAKWRVDGKVQLPLGILDVVVEQVAGDGQGAAEKACPGERFVVPGKFRTEADRDAGVQVHRHAARVVRAQDHRTDAHVGVHVIGDGELGQQRVPALGEIDRNSDRTVQ